MSRESNQLSINTTYSARGDRFFERHWADEQSSCGSVHGKHITIVLFVTGQHHCLTLHFILEPLGKHGTDGAVNQT